MLKGVCHILNYYPFGSIVESRSWKGDYRYGFNGQEGDDEVSGSGNSYTAEYWQYDSRLGRRWNVDPEGRIWESPFAVLGNNPINMIDPLGDEWGDGKEKAEEYKGAVSSKKETLQGTNESLKKKIDRISNSKISFFKEKRIANAQGQIGRNEENIQQLDAILCEWDELDKSKTVYNIYQTNSAQKNAGYIGLIKYNPTSKSIDMFVDFDDLGNMGHELTHAYQFEQGKISFMTGGDPGTLYDIHDEVEAFSRQMFLGDIGLGSYLRELWVQETGTSKVTPTSVGEWNDDYKYKVHQNYRDIYSFGRELDSRHKDRNRRYMDYQPELNKDMGQIGGHEVFKNPAK